MKIELREVFLKRESKEERFKRVAQKRTQRVIDAIRGLSQCSNRRMYNWNGEQLKKMWNVIDNELASSKKNYENSKPQEFRF